ncbi:MAG TPA: transcriptional repressor [Flavobacteriales bacterium]|jgi:Fur family ferric uptake transcriptional regulator|nr:transcriptional repressor [Flavobacteriales bacterium]
MESAEILSEHQLKATGCRIGILDLMIESGNALSENEIREKLESSFDRTTFYRSFKTLDEHGIIHKIVVDSQVVKYELDKSITNRKQHAHFYCKVCDAVQCIDVAEIPEVVVPKHYKIYEVELVLKGKCDKCSEMKSTRVQ